MSSLPLLILLGVIGPWQVVIIVALILVLFGGKKIPELMKGLGKGIRSFKEGMNNIEKDIENPDPDPKDKTNH